MLHTLHQRLDRHFPRYTQHDPLVPVWCVTPGEQAERGRAIHRFFDTSPISPSGRYLAVTRLGSECDYPGPGDTAQVCVIDLHTGEDRVVAETAGWEPQLGANVNWGASDRELIFQDVDTDTWTPRIVVIDPESGARQHIPAAGVYHVSPDGKLACGTDPAAMRRTQSGYGVVVPDEHVPRKAGLRDDDGLWLTDLNTGQRTLIVSIRQAIEDCEPAFEIDDPGRYEIYMFHSKFSPTGDRLLFTIRFYPDDGRSDFHRMAQGDLRFTVLTCKLDGSDIRNAVPTSKWKHGGHHINWCPDGQHLSMNLRLEPRGKLQLMRCGYDGSDWGHLTESVMGSGHPTVHPDGRHLLTDAYQHESLAADDGTVPLRWIDLRAGTERCALRIDTRQPVRDSVFRVDPHPAWDRSWRYVTFNGFVRGTRRVFVADFEKLLE